MKPFIVGNWKANRNLKVLDTLEYDPEVIEVGLAVPDIYYHIVKRNTDKHVKIVSQDCSRFNIGPYNGETPALLLKEAGVDYVIIGHHERRKYFNENAEILATKLHNALKAGLKVIYFLGETRKDREAGNHMNVLYNQFFTVIGKDITVDISYIPVWAIATGIHPSPDEISEIFKTIKKWASSINVTARILYGGSVNQKTIQDYGKIEELDGYLIATLSLSENFNTLLKEFEELHRKKPNKSLK